MTVRLEAHTIAEPGEWRFAAEARAASGTVRAGRDPLQVGNNGLGTPPPGARRPRRSANAGVRVASNVVAFPVAPAPARGRFAAAAGEQGATVTVVCALDSDRLPKGQFMTKLLGLPPRATAKPVTLEAGAKEAAFTVAIDAATPPGEYRSLVCELTGRVNGHAVCYRVGRAGILRVAPPGGTKTDASGRPLSPLEALRLESKTKRSK
jgi:hypothetical protein